MLFCGVVVAQESPEMEKRIAGLANELRCLVCQNQTIADSNAPLAVDLRGQIREQVKRGASDREILDFMTARYGDFVLYRPPLKAATIALWAGPFLLLAAGLWFLLRRIRRRGKAAEISEEDRARAAKLLQ
jgi:cytochrome c-type biogenesis protein CcmH